MRRRARSGSRCANTRIQYSVDLVITEVSVVWIIVVGMTVVALTHSSSLRKARFTFVGGFLYL